MSVDTVNYVRRRRDLAPAEFAVAYAMASHAHPKRGQLCTAAVATIARESGMGERGARKIIRRLETKNPPVVFARTDKKGGSHSQTIGYEFNTVTGEPLFPPQNSDGGTTGPARGNTDASTGEPPFPQKVLERKEKVEAVAPAALFSQDQMEKEILATWNYYLDASDRQETLIPSKKRMGFDVLRKLHEIGRRNPVVDLSCVIDMARQLARENPKKKFLFKWTAMFSNWNTCVSLWQEYQDSDRGIPEAATLPAEYLPPKPPPPPPPTPEEKARAAEEKARVDAAWKEMMARVHAANKESEKRMRERAAQERATQEAASRQGCETDDSPF